MTIYDIAKEAGVSASTVSRVINNRPGIKESTREDVMKVLKKYNFSVSAQARGLVNKSSMMIGILISDIRNLHYTEGAYIIEQRMMKDGYCSIIMNTGNSEEMMASSIKTLAERRVDGFVLIGSAFSNSLVKDAIEKYLPSLPFVLENGELALPNSAEILADDEKGAYDAVTFLKSKGRRKIAYINNNDTPSNRKKIEGYLKAVGNERIIIDNVDDSYGGGYDATLKLLKERSDVEAIIYAVDILALGGERAALDLNKKIPEDISIIGFDNSPYSYIANPKLSSVDSRLGELSTLCAESLIKLLKKEKTEEKIILPPSLVLREST